MFTTLDSFFIFFICAMTIIVLLLAYQDKLEALEKKHDSRRAARKSNRKK